MSNEQKKNPLESLNRPPFLIGGAAFALLCGGMGWIKFEYVIICVGACAVGVYLHQKKKAEQPKDK
jgi:hypothetical protein